MGYHGRAMVGCALAVLWPCPGRALAMLWTCHGCAVDRQLPSAQRTYHGRPASPTRHAYTLAFRDIMPLVQFALSSAYFTFMDRVFKQVQGSCIGMQASPVLCGIMAAVQE